MDLRSSLVPVTFEWRDGLYQKFPNFVRCPDGLRPDCPQCHPHLFRAEPLYMDRNYILVPGTLQIGHDGTAPQYGVVPGSFLVYPSEHITNPLHLSDFFMTYVMSAVRRLGLDTGYNLAMNIGKTAGQTTEVVHMWIADRELLSSYPGKGLVSILVDAMVADDAPKG